MWSTCYSFFKPTLSSLLEVRNCNPLLTRVVASFGFPLNFCKKILLLYIYIYIYILILVILFYKIIFFLLNNIIDSFKSNVILTNFFIIFLQIVFVANSYWFAHGPITYIIFFLPLTISYINNL